MHAGIVEVLQNRFMFYQLRRRHNNSRKLLAESLFIQSQQLGLCQ